MLNMFFIVPLIFLTIISIGIILLLFWIWTFIHCLRSNIRQNEKLIWLLVIVIFNILGSIIYLVFSRKNKNPHKYTQNKIFKNNKNNMISGVCSGLGDYFRIDPNIIRVIWIVLTIATGFIVGLLLYLILAIMLPEKK